MIMVVHQVRRWRRRSSRRCRCQAGLIQSTNTSQSGQSFLGRSKTSRTALLRESSERGITTGPLRALSTKAPISASIDSSTSCLRSARFRKQARSLLSEISPDRLCSAVRTFEPSLVVPSSTRKANPQLMHRRGYRSSNMRSGESCIGTSITASASLDDPPGTGH